MLTALRAEIDRLPRLYWVVWGGMLINRIGAFVLPFLTLYLTGQRRYEPEQAALMVSVFGAGSVLAGLIGGQLADRWGRKPTMVLSMVGGALAMLVFGQARASEAIAASVFALGFLAELYRPAVSALVGDIVPTEHRSRAYGHMYWAANLGFALAATTGGWLASSVGFELLFAVDAATMLSCALVIVGRVPETRPTARGGEAAEVGAGSPVYRDAVFVVFVSLTLASGLLMMQSGVTLPLALARQGIDEAGYGRIIALNGLLIVLLQPVLSVRLSARARRTSALAAGTLLMGLGFGLHGLADDPWTHAGAVAVWTLGEIVLVPLASATVADLAPADRRGRYQGLYSLTWSAAVLLGPSVGGRLWAWDAATLWSACVALGVVAALGHVALGPAREREVARRTLRE